MTQITPTRFLAISTALMFALASPAFAQEAGNTAPTAQADAKQRTTLSLKGASKADARVAQNVVNALAAQGFRTTELSRTWLGRIRVVAENTASEARETRELIVSSATGAIMSDRLLSAGANATAAANAQAGVTAGAAQDRTTAETAAPRANGGVGASGSGSVSIGGSLGGSISDTVGGSVEGSTSGSAGGSAGSSGGSVSGSGGGSVGGSGGLGLGL